MFNVESRPELERIGEVAERLGMRARAAVRVNPDVDPRTHAKTTTGKGGTKFGIGIDETEKLFADAAGLAGVEVCGIHLHLGSPIYSTEPYEQALEKALALIGRLQGGRQAGGVAEHGRRLRNLLHGRGGHRPGGLCRRDEIVS